jgi:hypothetical protein
VEAREEDQQRTKREPGHAVSRRHGRIPFCCRYLGDLAVDLVAMTLPRDRRRRVLWGSVSRSSRGLAYIGVC